MTQSKLMRLPVLLCSALVIIVVSPIGFPQSAEEDFRVSKASPRLLLTARRARLLQRERERQSIRWVQYETTLASTKAMPEEGFALALYYVASQSEKHGRRAVEWALKADQGSELRQIAIVFDWCQSLLSEAESDQLAEKLKAGIERTRSAADVPSVRSRILAAVALGDRVPELAARELEQAVRNWWREGIAPKLREGKQAIPREDGYALFEILHVVRDNLHIDLREDARAYFKELAMHRLLTYYPAPYPGPQNDYRIPLMEKPGEPDLREATLSRAADFAIVAFDTNALENQFLQGWLIQDRFLLRSALGIPYEFLWANPYQPGLSYHHVPLQFHERLSGTLILRSSWEEDAHWFYYADGMRQWFENGGIQVLGLKEMSIPLEVGPHVVLPGASPMRFAADRAKPTSYFIVNLKPNQRYEIEVDDEEMYDAETDAGGILVLHYPAGRNAGVRLREFQAGAR